MNQLKGGLDDTKPPAYVAEMIHSEYVNSDQKVIYQNAPAKDNMLLWSWKDTYFYSLYLNDI